MKVTDLIAKILKRNNVKQAFGLQGRRCRQVSLNRDRQGLHAQHGCTRLRGHQSK